MQSITPCATRLTTGKALRDLRGLCSHDLVLYHRRGSAKERTERKVPYREKDTLYREMCEEYLDRDGMTVPPIRPLRPIFPDAGEEGSLLLTQLLCHRILTRVLRQVAMERNST